MNLSAQGRTLITELRDILRQEYREGCRNSQDIEQHLSDALGKANHWPDKEESKLLKALVRNLDSHSYLKANRQARRRMLTETGLQLSRVLGDAPTTQVSTGVGPPPATLDSRYQLDTEVMYLKGVGPKMGELLARIGIHTLSDLIGHLPFRWEDRTQVVTAHSAPEGEAVVIKGILGPTGVRSPRKGMTIVTCPLHTPDGVVDLVWFNQKWILNSLKKGAEVYAFGKFERKFRKGQMASPEIESADDEHRLAGRWVPVYPVTGRMSQRWIRSLMFLTVPSLAPKMLDPLPEPLRKARGFQTKGQALLEYHFPTAAVGLAEARRRLAYEELFLLQIEIGLQRRTRELEPRQTVYKKEKMRPENFFSLLPFQPTGAQSRVADEIITDLTSRIPMNRLLQGDVGSGKTVVAAFAAWAAVQQGYQAVIMAPTEILAEQHYQKLKTLLEPAGIRMAFLSGSVRKKKKDEVKKQLEEHEIDLAVGTHALIQPDVNFAKLSLVVVDEQHKFGVMQRTVLRQKGYMHNPDLLVMTATPIPRTLALTVHGELEVSRLDEMPPGRQPIKSEYVRFSKRKKVYEEIRAELNAGRQAYIICPLIEESEAVEATSATEEHKVIAESVFPEFSVGLLHGRMKAADKEQVMEEFRQGNHQVLVSTTVIEVGVDVPNATVMLVQDANRFGLSQLHQLRGRVGRGEHSSRCIFMADTKSQDGRRRLEAIAKLSDGFEVAEEDLQIRGPGDYYGLRQSGFPEFQVADLTRDLFLLEQAQKDARLLIDRDPELRSAPNLKRCLSLRAERTAELVH
ncbi:MAG TPA: ATP-dependent DNA helicase RecG [Phycisphaerales bacterium]|nr:ATP-dependent DNA helicase RecG [Phycisphaerales bacterium]